MGFRYRKSFGKGPFKVTVSKSGIGYSAGVKGFRVTKKAGGGVRTTASIPGTGISYVKDSGSGKSRSSSTQASRSTAPTHKSSRTEQTPGSKLAVWCIVCLVAGVLLIASVPVLAFALFVAALVLALRMIKLKKEAENSAPKMIHAQPAGTPRRIAGVPKSMREDVSPAPQPPKPEPLAQEPAVPEPGTPRVAGKTHKVTGVEHYRANILSLDCENPDFDMTKREIIDCGMTDERIFEYSYCSEKVELIPEPDNPEDPKAIKVLVEGLHVGYIKAGSCSRIHNLMNENRIRRITCQIEGGRFKKVYENEDDDTHDLETGERRIYVDLTVYEVQK